MLLWIAPVIGGLLGGKAGRSQARTQNQPTVTTTTRTPPSALGGWSPVQQGLGWLTSAFNPENLPNLGTTNQQREYGNSLIRDALDNPFELPDLGSLMHGFSAPGYTPQLFEEAGGGGGGWENFVETLKGEMGHGNWSGFLDQLLPKIRNEQATPTPYEQMVQDGRFLDVGNNPHVQAMSEAIRQSVGEDRALALSQAASPFMADSGTMGMSGANLAARGQIVDDYSENIANQLAAANYNLYGQERGLQNQVADILSGRTNALRQLAAQAGASAYGSDQAREASQFSSLAGAGASAYGSDNALAAALQQALIGADVSAHNAQLAAMASAYGSQLGLSGQYLGALNQNNALNWGRQTDSWNILNQMANQDNQNEMFRLGSIVDYNSLLNQIVSGWSPQVSSQQGPQTSSRDGFIQGALGGVMGGFGLNNLMGRSGLGGKAGKGGGYNPGNRYGVNF